MRLNLAASVLSESLRAVPTEESLYVCAKLLQSCLTLHDLMDCSPPGYSVPGILRARILDWVAMSSSRESS